MKGSKCCGRYRDFFTANKGKSHLTLLCRLSQSLNDTENRYQELQMKVDSLGGESGGLNSINQKAMDIKKEAEDLLSKATKGIDQLKSEYTSCSQR